MEGCAVKLGSVLHYPRSPFAFRDGLVSTCQVDHRAIWYRLDQRLERGFFAVGMHYRDAKAVLETILVDLLEHL
jgi:hypothetical protein